MRDTISFGRWLKRLRVDLDLTQDALAAAVGCATQTIRTFESGTRRPSRDMVERLADVLDIPAEQRADFVHLARMPASPPAPRPGAPRQAQANQTGSQVTDSTSSLPPDAGPRARDGQSEPGHAPLLVTKLYLPRPRAQLVLRPRLIARLAAGLTRPLTVIAAPAGFGKTTLLADWLRHKDQSSRTVAWLALDATDSDPLQFLRYLVAALQTIDPAIGATTLTLLRAAQAPPMETLLPLLLNDLAHLPDPSILVLDDYHVVDALAVHQALAFLLDHLPPQLHLVLASRADPPLALSRLRARGQLTELRAQELRFTPEEAATFLQEVMRLPLSAEDVAALEVRTEGWIAGLQLAALSLRDRPSEQRAQFIEAFAGSNRFVVDYLVDEVLARQPGRLQTFLLRTSILERLTGALCDAVVVGAEGQRSEGVEEAGDGGGLASPIPQRNGQALLEYLERANLFIVAMDDERRWYRYHHLFAQVLRERLMSSTSQDVMATLHRRASAWFAAQGLVVEAVQHALAAQDWERAARLIEEHGLLLMLQGHLQQVTDWLDGLPDTRIRERPVLSIIRAVSFMLSNRLAMVEPYLQHAERWIQPDTPDDQARTIRGAAAVIRGNVSYLVGDLPRLIAFVHEALEVLPETEVSVLPGMLVTIFRSAATSFTGLAYKVTGDVTAASERVAADVIAPVRAAGNLFATLYSMTYLALLQVYQGRLRVATDTYAQAAQLAPEAGGPHILVASPTYYIGRGDLLRERNELDAAAQYLRQGIDIVRGTMTIDANAATHGYIAWARLQQARGDSLGARATLEEFRHLADQRDFFHVLVARGAAARAQLELAQGDLSAASRWAETSGLGVDDELAFFRESEYLALARVYIAQGRHSSVRHILCDTLHLLDRLLENAERGGRGHSVIEILILRALALHSQGDLHGVLAPLERAVTLGAPEGYVRLFVDEGMPMATLLAEALGEQGNGLERKPLDQDVAAYARKLLAVLRGEGIDPGSVPHGPTYTSLAMPPGVETLTDREQEVLRLLVAGYSNQAIADELVVAVGTVKRHVSNIMGKLGAQSRLEAVARARDLGVA